MAGSDSRGVYLSRCDTLGLTAHPVIAQRLSAMDAMQSGTCDLSSTPASLSLEALVEVLLVATGVVRVDLRATGCTDAHVDLLAHQLPRAVAVKQLDLSHNPRITDASARLLLDLVAEERFTDCHLSSCGVSDGLVAQIADAAALNMARDDGAALRGRSRPGALAATASLLAAPSHGRGASHGMLGSTMGPPSPLSPGGPSGPSPASLLPDLRVLCGAAVELLIALLRLHLWRDLPRSFISMAMCLTVVGIPFWETSPVAESAILVSSLLFLRERRMPRLFSLRRAQGSGWGLLPGADYPRPALPGPQAHQTHDHDHSVVRVGGSPQPMAQPTPAESEETLRQYPLLRWALRVHQQLGDDAHAADGVAEMAHRTRALLEWAQGRGRKALGGVLLFTFLVCNFVSVPLLFFVASLWFFLAAPYRAARARGRQLLEPLWPFVEAEQRALRPFAPRLEDRASQSREGSVGPDGDSWDPSLVGGDGMTPFAFFVTVQRLEGVTARHANGAAFVPYATVRYDRQSWTTRAVPEPHAYHETAPAAFRSLDRPWKLTVHVFDASAEVAGAVLQASVVVDDCLPFDEDVTVPLVRNTRPGAGARAAGGAAGSALLAELLDDISRHDAAASARYGTHRRGGSSALASHAAPGTVLVDNAGSVVLRFTRERAVALGSTTVAVAPQAGVRLEVEPASGHATPHHRDHTATPGTAVRAGWGDRRSGSSSLASTPADAALRRTVPPSPDPMRPGIPPSASAATLPESGINETPKDTSPGNVSFSSDPHRPTPKHHDGRTFFSASGSASGGVGAATPSRPREASAPAGLPPPAARTTGAGLAHGHATHTAPALPSPAHPVALKKESLARTASPDDLSPSASAHTPPPPRRGTADPRSLEKTMKKGLATQSAPAVGPTGPLSPPPDHPAPAPAPAPATAQRTPVDQALPWGGRGTQGGVSPPPEAVETPRSASIPARAGPAAPATPVVAPTPRENRKRTTPKTTPRGAQSASLARDSQGSQGSQGLLSSVSGSTASQQGSPPTPDRAQARSSTTASPTGAAQPAEAQPAAVAGTAAAPVKQEVARSPAAPPVQSPRVQSAVQSAAQSAVQSAAGSPRLSGTPSFSGPQRRDPLANGRGGAGAPQYQPGYAAALGRTSSTPSGSGQSSRSSSARGAGQPGLTKTLSGQSFVVTPKQAAVSPQFSPQAADAPIPPPTPSLRPTPGRGRKTAGSPSTATSSVRETALDGPGERARGASLMTATSDDRSDAPGRQTPRDPTDAPKPVFLDVLEVSSDGSSHAKGSPDRHAAATPPELDTTPAPRQPSVDMSSSTTESVTVVNKRKFTPRTTPSHTPSAGPTVSPQGKEEAPRPASTAQRSPPTGAANGGEWDEACSMASTPAEYRS